VVKPEVLHLSECLLLVQYMQCIGELLKAIKMGVFFINGRGFKNFARIILTTPPF
jgi:hypothetical protein